MNGSDVWGSSAPYGDVLPCSNGIFIRKISSFMKLRIIAVQAGNEIKKFQMTLGIFFSPKVFCRLSSIMTVLKGKYSFFCKYSI